MTEFHEDERRYAVVQFNDDVKNVTYIYFRDGEWYLTEVYETSWDHPEYTSSRYFEVRGFTGPLADYIQEYNKAKHIQAQTRVVKMNLSEFLDNMIFEGKSKRGN